MITLSNFGWFRFCRQGNKWSELLKPRSIVITAPFYIVIQHLVLVFLKIKIIFYFIYKRKRCSVCPFIFIGFSLHHAWEWSWAHEVEHMLRNGRAIHIKALVSYFPSLILAPSNGIVYTRRPWGGRVWKKIKVMPEDRSLRDMDNFFVVKVDPHVSPSIMHINGLDWGRGGQWLFSRKFLFCFFLVLACHLRCQTVMFLNCQI